MVEKLKELCLQQQRLEQPIAELSNSMSAQSVAFKLLLEIYIPSLGPAPAGLFFFFKKLIHDVTSTSASANRSTCYKL